MAAQRALALILGVNHDADVDAFDRGGAGRARHPGVQV
jgi:hypothetical protein